MCVMWCNVFLRAKIRSAFIDSEYHHWLKRTHSLKQCCRHFFKTSGPIYGSVSKGKLIKKWRAPIDSLSVVWSGFSWVPRNSWNRWTSYSQEMSLRRFGVPVYGWQGGFSRLRDRCDPFQGSGPNCDSAALSVDDEFYHSILCSVRQFHQSILDAVVTVLRAFPDGSPWLRAFDDRRAVGGAGEFFCRTKLRSPNRRAPCCHLDRLCERRAPRTAAVGRSWPS